MTRPDRAWTLPHAQRRRYLAVLALSSVGASVRPLAHSASSACLAVADWTHFVDRHIQRDGRIIDFHTAEQHSTSEGQSYGLFFALVHNDRSTFDRVLRWTDANLADGRLAQRLPAWRWGRKPGGSWGVLDTTPASDADLWIAYALVEAGRLWSEPGYQALGRSVLANAAREEVVALPGLGRMLLPWPRSVAGGPLWRLNASYLPLQLLRRFQQEDAQGPWREIADNTVRMLEAVAPRGFAPDWCAWSEKEQAFVADPEKSTAGSYDAIRIYLWAGMLHAQDPARPRLLAALHGPRGVLAQNRPLAEYVDADTGAARGNAPVGFAGALLPYLKAQGLEGPLRTQIARIRERVDSPAQPASVPLPYYERILLLFGQSWLDGRYAFGRDGGLQPNWRLLCPSTHLV
ncbi:cellulose synthase complex periplasmic endoglucanase BcsZ [Variovorax soli]|uniref:Glucanase n=1 Tax=Variovorax soli TaxID=376815 RepID=A0ABU1NDC1_9BURK|nr:cellulose synthase complex periplasmic endoglucanase BcsZ [Variovorax soli]MDR6536444.1 endoglucanase [Variovorax soli]